MDWFKIKVQHVLNSGLSAEDIGRLVIYQALIALKERIPTEAEISKVMRVQSLLKLRRTLVEQGENADSIANKVLFDVQEVAEERQFQRDKKRNQRRKLRLGIENVPRDVPISEFGDVPDKIREDKIREDNISSSSPLNPPGDCAPPSGDFFENEEPVPKIWLPGSIPRCNPPNSGPPPTAELKARVKLVIDRLFELGLKKAADPPALKAHLYNSFLDDSEELTAREAQILEVEGKLRSEKQRDKLAKINAKKEELMARKQADERDRAREIMRRIGEDARFAEIEKLARIKAIDQLGEDHPLIPKFAFMPMFWDYYLKAANELKIEYIHQGEKS